MHSACPEPSEEWAGMMKEERVTMFVRGSHESAVLQKDADTAWA